jgi:hypothetical protein
MLFQVCLSYFTKLQVYGAFSYALPPAFQVCFSYFSTQLSVILPLGKERSETSCPTLDLLLVMACDCSCVTILLYSHEARIIVSRTAGAA